jgi:hypothetical protein
MDLLDNEKYSWQAGSGRNITLDINTYWVDVCSSPGPCDNAVVEALEDPDIIEQVKMWDQEELADELSEYTDWDVSDHRENIERMLWIACGDIRESPEDYPAT